MRSYVERAKAHLSDYRRSRLGSLTKYGLWSGNNKSRILTFFPKRLCWLNLIETYRAEMREFLEESGIQLHQGLSPSKLFASCLP